MALTSVRVGSLHEHRRILPLPFFGVGELDFQYIDIGDTCSRRASISRESSRSSSCSW